jgi:tRNA-2-methylthio-N6-dimethylallyladenosine synthase
MKIHIKTFGCQMNSYDALAMEGLMREKGFIIAGSMEEADICILETCSVRQKAEDKVIGVIGQLAKRKRQKGKPLIIVAGCMAERMKKDLTGRFPEIDLVIGPGHVNEIAERVQKLTEKKSGKEKIAAGFDEHLNPLYHKGLYLEFKDVTAFVTVITGCTNYCSYCIVPFVRGKEMSRPENDIIEEINELAGRGVKEVTLLGQNVNAYGKDLKPETSFLSLLKKVAGVKGILRVRFVTSHPKDTPEEVIAFMKENKKACPYLHMPFQSGADCTLRKMNRKYTREEYLGKIAAFRGILPEIALSTDIIVGYPGETEEDFLQTKDLLEKVRFDMAYIFKYSDRKGTKAAGECEKVPASQIMKRHKALLDLQNAITLEKNRAQEGKDVEVLVEGLSKTNPSRLTGRTRHNKIAVFPADEKLKPGDIARLRVVRASPHSLYCEP